jgi:aspartyl-tRNA(Asn)/glutamyl-tRNA(Gln) amidotransferase subunit A
VGQEKARIKLIVQFYRMKEIHEETISTLHCLLEQRKISSQEIIQKIIDRINEVEPKVRAFISPTPQEALAKARKVDAKISKGEEISFLAGIPVAIKDSFLTKGVRTTAGSKVLKNYLGQYDATVVKRLKDADAVIIGKTNLDEFSLGFTTETSAFGVTVNPWDLARVSGGSSGGSAAAVAAGESFYAIGSEHYDSIRQPAAWCGVVGFKPTYGLVSRYGIVAMASSLECPGPITKTVQDAAIDLSTIAGFDKNDANSLKNNVPDYWRGLNPSVKGIRLGIADAYFNSERVEDGVLKKVEGAVRVFEQLGAKLVSIKLPPLKQTSPIFEVLYRCEVASNLARYDGLRFGKRYKKRVDLESLYLRTRKNFGPLLKYLMLTELRAVAGGQFESIYNDALKLRSLVISEFKNIFEKVDLVISPMTPCVAFKKGFYKDGRYHGTIETDRFREIVDIIAQLPALGGLPGISLPCGFSQGLPVGLQIYGPLFREQNILNTAYAYEEETKWYKFTPNL